MLVSWIVALLLSLPPHPCICLVEPQPAAPTEYIVHLPMVMR